MTTKINEDIQEISRWSNTVADKSFTVGRLGERWQFPSDHLPVGVECEKTRFVSWNALNNAAMHHITEDKQGLKGSMVTALHSNNQKLTKRDEKVATFTQEMLSKVDVIGEQECAMPYLEHLSQSLPSQWALVKSYETDVKDQVALLYNRTTMTLVQSETVLDAMPSAPGRAVQKVTLKNNLTGRVFVVINGHLPGKRDIPARQEFANFVKKSSKPDATTVVLGDNNFLRGDMMTAYKTAGFAQFKLHSPWNTIVADNKSSKCIDHIFVYNGNSRNLAPSEILPEESRLRETIALLNSPAKL